MFKCFIIQAPAHKDHSKGAEGLANTGRGARGTGAGWENGRVLRVLGQVRLGSEHGHSLSGARGGAAQGTPARKGSHPEGEPPGNPPPGLEALEQPRRRTVPLHEAQRESTARDCRLVAQQGSPKPPCSLLKNKTDSPLMREEHIEHLRMSSFQRPSETIPSTHTRTAQGQRPLVSSSGKGDADSHRHGVLTSALSSAASLARATPPISHHPRPATPFSLQGLRSGLGAPPQRPLRPTRGHGGSGRV